MFIVGSMKFYVKLKILAIFKTALSKPNEAPFLALKAPLPYSHRTKCSLTQGKYLPTLPEGF
jgi:hypothetical protein